MTLQERTSADEAIERFDTEQAAAKYSKSLVGSATHQREMRCILAGLGEMKRGAKVLDLPCGTGRLLKELSERGWEVVSADSSAHMVGLAKDHAKRVGLNTDAARFVVASVMKTPFGDGEFDGVVCNRLLHHFREADVRQAALKELRRICKGRIVVSFFSSASFDGVMFKLKDAMRRRKATDRIPISSAEIEADVRASGLRVAKWLWTRRGISKQCYVALERV
ncbi:MAG TPA: class I SAM-dependent methyltransferase [Phycisphaerales bacterium]|nr:class I SAM-dependent methyltransferase [Phycisphaerales bacterium]